MSQGSKITWTDHTFNPWWGCTEVAPECDNCYAKAWAKRCGHDVWGVDAPRRFFSDKHWAEPTKWNKGAESSGERQRVFCASMGDVAESLQSDVGLLLDDSRARLWELIEETGWLDWLLLTKRPQNLMRLMPQNWQERLPPNIWVGATAGTQASAAHNTRALMKIPAAVRFLSMEPLLERVDLRLDDPSMHAGDGRALDWIITGGESGPGRREPDVEWIGDIVSACGAADVPVFVKQDAGRQPGMQGRIPNGLWIQQFPAAPAGRGD